MYDRSYHSTYGWTNEDRLVVKLLFIVKNKQWQSLKKWINEIVYGVGVLKLFLKQISALESKLCFLAHFIKQSRYKSLKKIDLVW